MKIVEKNDTIAMSAIVLVAGVFLLQGFAVDACLGLGLIAGFILWVVLTIINEIKLAKEIKNTHENFKKSGRLFAGSRSVEATVMSLTFLKKVGYPQLEIGDYSLDEENFWKSEGVKTQKVNREDHGGTGVALVIYL